MGIKPNWKGKMGKICCGSPKKALGRNTFIVIGIISGLLLVTELFTANVKEIPEETYKKEFNRKYSVFALDVPSELSFANEKVPLHYFEIKESLDREILSNTYFHSQTLLFIKKSTRFLPLVEKILKEEGIPEDFKYLPFIESGYTNATSPAGAIGYWQFMKGTATDYGLEVNKEIDERYHLEKSTKAACAFLKESYEKYGSWTLAAASYNIGRRRLSEELERQKVGDYYDLLLNQETARYVFRILAVKLIIESPSNYGFQYRDKDLYQEIETKLVKVDSAVTHFADLAKDQKINYKILKYFNPWLRKHYLTNTKKKTYYLAIPKNENRISEK